METEEKGMQERSNRFASKAIKWSRPVVEQHGVKNDQCVGISA